MARVAWLPMQLKKNVQSVQPDVNNITRVSCFLLITQACTHTRGKASKATRSALLTLDLLCSCCPVFHIYSHSGHPGVQVRSSLSTGVPLLRSHHRTLVCSLFSPHLSCPWDLNSLSHLWSNVRMVI